MTTSDNKAGTKPDLPEAKGRFVKRSEAKALLAQGGWTRDPENDGPYGWDAYVSDRGELLLFMKHGRSVLYESRKARMDEAVTGGIYEPYIDIDLRRGLYLNPFLEPYKTIYEGPGQCYQHRPSASSCSVASPRATPKTSCRTSSWSCAVALRTWIRKLAPRRHRRSLPRPLA